MILASPGAKPAGTSQGGSTKSQAAIAEGSVTGAATTIAVEVHAVASIHAKNFKHCKATQGCEREIA